MPLTAHHGAASGSTASQSKLFFLGPPGTYSHQVALNAVPQLQKGEGGHQIALEPCQTISLTLQMAKEWTTQTGACAWALLPYENNSNGPVLESYDLLFDLDGRRESEGAMQPAISIDHEYYLPVRHALMCTAATRDQLKTPGSSSVDLKKLAVVSSHTQALGQCSRFIQEHLRSDVEQIATTSTGEAARLLMMGTRQIETGRPPERLEACIASTICAQENIFDLVILQKEIQNSSRNVTRFLLLKTSKEVEVAATARTSSSAEVTMKMALRIATHSRGQALTSLASALAASNSQEPNLRCKICTIERRAAKYVEEEQPIATAMEEADSQGHWPSVYLVEMEAAIYSGQQGGIGSADDRPRSAGGSDGPAASASQTLLKIFQHTAQDAKLQGHVGLLGLWPKGSG